MSQASQHRLYQLHQQPLPHVSGASPRTSNPTLLAQANQTGGGGSQVPTLHKQLSFVQTSVHQIREVVPSASPHTLEFRKDFWTAALSNQPAFEVYGIQNLTIYQWSIVFYKWSKARLNGKMKILLDYHQLKAVLGSHLTWDLVKLFDSKGYAQVNQQGRTNLTLKKIRVNILEVMVAGVALSKLISQRHKLQFLYSLFDMDDSGAITRMQFTSFLKTFYKSLSAIFAIDHKQIPTLQDCNQITDSLFDQIDQDKSGSISSREMVEWTLSHKAESRPGSLLMKLLIFRFSSERCADSAEKADAFDDGIDSFQLSWHNPAPPLPESRCPVHGSNLISCQYLSRQEVVSAKTFFEQATGKRSGSFVSDDSTISSREWEDILSSTVASLENTHGQHFNITNLLRILCPCAQPKHIKMFLDWCDQWDRLVRNKDLLSKVNRAEDILTAERSKPKIPEETRFSLERQFDQLDPGDGLIRKYDFQIHWNWTREQIDEMFDSHDVTGDQFLDKYEFFRMMCPPEYALPTEGGDQDEVHSLFSKWLRHESSIAEAHVGVKAKEVKSSRGSRTNLKWRTPSAMLPPVPDDLFYHWMDVFESLDIDENGSLSVVELRGVLPDEVCWAICSVVDKKSDDSFSKEKFLKSMCRAHGYREPPSLSARCPDDPDDSPDQ